MESLAVAVRRARIAKAEPKVVIEAMIEPVIESEPVVETPKPAPVPVPVPVLILPTASCSQEPSLNAISMAVGSYFNISRIELRSHRRPQRIVRGRQVVAYIANKMTRLTMPAIGRQMGGFDHTTILHSVRKISALRETDPKIDEAVTAIMAALERSPWTPREGTQ